VPKTVPLAHRGAAVFAALTSLTVLAAPFNGALGASAPVTVVNTDTNPVPTNVVNPATSPVPTAVVNPSTSPALTSRVDDPGRAPYQSTSSCQGTCGSFSFSAVPSGHRLIIEHVSGQFQFTGTPISLDLELLGPHQELLSDFFIPFFGFVSAFDQPVLVYLDAGTAPSVFLGSQHSGTLTVNLGTVALTGYVVDCTTSPCAPIAQ
jgi:hypothetical protein